MKILHLCLGNFFIDGYSYQENMITKHHALMGHDVKVLASLVSFDNNGKVAELPKADKHIENGCLIQRINYKKFPSISINRFLRRYEGLYHQIEDFAPDIIFSHNVSYCDSITVYRYLKKHPNVKLYCDSHADYINSARNFLSKYLKHKMIWSYGAKLLAKRSEKCFGVTPMRCEFLHKIYGIDKEKIDFLPLGFDDSAIPSNVDFLSNEIRTKLSIPKNAFIISTGGKIDRLKNIHHLLSSIDKLSDNRIHVIIFGVITDEMKDTMKKYTTRSNYHFVGWCNSSQVMDYLCVSDLCVFPGTHSTLWEQAVGLAKPCVLKYWGEEMTHMNTNSNCIFVKGENEEELADTIGGLIFTDNYSNLLRNAEKAAPLFKYSNIAKKSIGLIP